MKKWIDELRASLTDVLGPPEFDDLLDALHTEAPTSLRLNPRKQIDDYSPRANPVPWHSRGYYLAERPRFNHELGFHLGSYYVQEASSMFLQYVLQQLQAEPSRILDLCAAPGGKSTDLIDSFPEALIISNEVNTARRNTLEENLSKWGSSNVLLSGGSAAQFGQLQHYFDLIMIDAPCSGEGMLRKSTNARDQYNAALVKQCATLQSHLLDQVLPALKPGGNLIYSTCTWNTEENEAHFASRSNLAAIELSIAKDWNVQCSGKKAKNFCRLYPHLVRGEGLTISSWQKLDDFEPLDRRAKAPSFTLEALKGKPLSHPKGHLWRDAKETLYISKPDQVDDISTILKYVPAHPIVTLGRLDRRKQLIPHIALAQQLDFHHDFESVEVDPATAHQYIKRENLPKMGDVGTWQCLTTKGLPLGWIKNLERRANNYYPKARALMS